MSMEEKDVEEMGEVAVPRSLSLRQWIALLFLLYFGGTGTLFLLVESGLVGQSSIFGSPDQPQLNETEMEHAPEEVLQPTVEQLLQEMIRKRSEQVELDLGEEVFVAHGDIPQISWVGDRYAVLCSIGGWSGNGSSLYVTYSENAVNWSEPVLMAAGLPDNMISGGIKGALIRATNGTYIFLCGRGVEGDENLRLLTSTSQDGLIWTPPVLLPNGSMRIFDLYGVTIVERQNGGYTIAFSGDLFQEDPEWNRSGDYWDSGEWASFVVATMESPDGVSWSEPEFARTPEDHMYPSNYLYSGGTISLAEREDGLYIAHVDGAGDVWVGPEVGSRWNISQASPEAFFSYFGGSSMVHLTNGSSVVAFDHLKNIYIIRSEDMATWEYPVWVSAGQQPTIAPVGNDSLLLAYEGGGGIYVKLIAKAPEEPSYAPAEFEIALPDSGSDLYSSDTFNIQYNSSKASSSVAGWEDERLDFMVFDSDEGNFTLFGEPKTGWMPRINKYMQSTGVIVWKLHLKYPAGEPIKRLNVYAGGTFGSDSTWYYSESTDTWTVNFVNALCEEIDLNTGEIEESRISFTLTVRRL